MGSYNVITVLPLRYLNTAERRHVLVRMDELLTVARNAEQSSVDEGPAIQSSGTLAVESLNISEEQVQHLRDLIAKYQSITYQSTASSLTAEMKAIDKERCRVMNYAVRRILDYDNLLTSEEQEAGKLMSYEMRPYAYFYNKPIRQKTDIIDGFLEDVRKEQYTNAVEVLAITPYIEEVERLNNEYRKLEAERSSLSTEKRKMTTAAELLPESQDLIDDICHMAVAANLINQSEVATTFIDEVNNLFAETRAARNKRGSEQQKDGGQDGETEGGDDSGGDNSDLSDGSTDSSTVPGETEEPDDRPVVQ